MKGIKNPLYFQNVTHFQVKQDIQAGECRTGWKTPMWVFHTWMSLDYGVQDSSFRPSQQIPVVTLLSKSILICYFCHNLYCIIVNHHWILIANYWQDFKKAALLYLIQYSTIIPIWLLVNTNSRTTSMMSTEPESYFRSKKSYIFSIFPKIHWWIIHNKARNMCKETK